MFIEGVLIRRNDDVMLHITGNNANVINYSCDCSTKGFCMVKPVDEDAVIVVDVKCPNCFQAKRVLILQYSSEKNRKTMLENMDNLDFCWSAIVENKVV
jgi:hypothetical protein